MKKFILLQFVIILVGSLLLLVLRANIDNRGVLSNNANVSDFINSDAYLASLLSSDDISDSYEELFSQITAYNETYNMETCVILATATGKFDSYNYMTTQYVNVNKVIVGASDLENQELKLYDYDRSFVIEDQELFNRRIEKLPSLGYSKEDYPEYYVRNSYYYPTFNLMKENHQYLIFIGKINVNNEAFYKISGGFTPYFDLAEVENKIISEDENTLLKYSDYYDNEVFPDSQQTDEKYQKLKDSVFEHYGIDKVNNV